MPQKHLRKFVMFMAKFTNCQVRNWFLKFHSGDTLLRDEPRPRCSSEFDQDALKDLVECKPFKST